MLFDDFNSYANSKLISQSRGLPATRSRWAIWAVLYIFQAFRNERRRATWFHSPISLESLFQGTTKTIRNDCKDLFSAICLQNNRLRDRFFSSKSWQGSWQAFFGALFETGTQNMVYREETGPVTVFWTEQGDKARSCPAWQPVSGPVFRNDSVLLSWLQIFARKTCLKACLDFR